MLRISRLKFLLACLAAVGIQAYFLFSRWGSHFEHITGAEVFDLQPFLTPKEIYAQLPAYTEQAIAVYWKFVALDYLFPVTGALSVVLLLGMILSKSKAAVSKGLLKSRLWLVPLGIIPFDWLENTGFVFLIANFPARFWSVARYTCWSKYTKMLFVVLLNIVLLVAVLSFLWERFFKSKK